MGKTGSSLNRHAEKQRTIPKSKCPHGSVQCRRERNRTSIRQPLRAKVSKQLAAAVNPAGGVRVLGCLATHHLICVPVAKTPVLPKYNTARVNQMVATPPTSPTAGYSYMYNVTI